MLSAIADGGGYSAREGRLVARSARHARERGVTAAAVVTARREGTSRSFVVGGVARSSRTRTRAARAAFIAALAARGARRARSSRICCEARPLAGGGRFGREMAPLDVNCHRARWRTSTAASGSRAAAVRGSSPRSTNVRAVKRLL